MLGLIGGFLGNMLGSSKATDVALDAVRKIGGLDDMNAKEKADYVLKYMEATKHQSPMRRFIAFVTATIWGLLVLNWMVAAGFGYIPGHAGSMAYANALMIFMRDVIDNPYNLILCFYFAMGIAGKLKS